MLVSFQIAWQKKFWQNVLAPMYSDVMNKFIKFEVKVFHAHGNLSKFASPSNFAAFKFHVLFTKSKKEILSTLYGFILISRRIHVTRSCVLGCVAYLWESKEYMLPWTWSLKWRKNHTRKSPSAHFMRAQNSALFFSWKVNKQSHYLIFLKTNFVAQFWAMSSFLTWFQKYEEEEALHLDFRTEFA